ncbi:putative quinol monooxygenase [Thalassotalea hakodatensis]|uniref:putative quinol monooxygenase n=1 Tax=Thalassotalea hakodatensis TaxID=3030492 RepID=UPI002573E5CD|nr:antibiotic biosynthesis monooxygenase family protein [Thalassotalea hakodatensis]
MIHRVNQFYAADNQAQSLKEFFQELVDYINNSEGCMGCQLLQDEQDDSHFVILEQWQTKEAHQASLSQYPADKMQAAMPLFGKPPEGDYYTLIKE